jgi:hypothetical protein
MNNETEKIREELAKGRSPVDILIDLIREHNKKLMEKKQRE